MTREEFKEELKRSLSIDQVADLVAELGGEPMMIDESTFTARTICHEGDSHKLYFYLNQGDGGLFHCYTSCGSFDIFELVRKVQTNRLGTQWSLPQAINFVAHFFGVLTEFQEEDFSSTVANNDWQILKRYNKGTKEKAQKKIEYKHYDPRIIASLPQPIIAPWIKEGIGRQVMESCGIHYDPINEAIIIPHYDENGNLIGIRQRTLIEELEKYGKYLPARINGIMYNHSLGFTVYGLNWAKENIKRMGKVLVFESEKSVLKYISDFGPENNIAVAVCGSNLTTTQVDLLREAGARELVICFDRQGEKDKTDKYVKKFYTMHSKFSPYIKLSFVYDKKGEFLGWKDSPIDNGAEVFTKLYERRIYL